MGTIFFLELLSTGERFEVPVLPNGMMLNRVRAARAIARVFYDPNRDAVCYADRNNNYFSVGPGGRQWAVGVTPGRLGRELRIIGTATDREFRRLDQSEAPSGILVFVAVTVRENEIICRETRKP